MSNGISEYELQEARRPGRAVVLIDHDASAIRNAAIVRVGRHKLSSSGETACDMALASAFHQGINSTRTIEVSSSTTTDDADARDPATVLDRLLFRGGPVAHLNPLKLPVLRFGHPFAKEDNYRLDLTDTLGVVIGRVANAWFDGRQLRADLIFSREAPTMGWTDFLPKLMLKASVEPWDMGLSICAPQVSGRVLPVAVDLVSFPAANAHGLLGSPIADFKAVGTPALDVHEWTRQSRAIAAKEKPIEPRYLDRRSRAATAMHTLRRKRLAATDAEEKSA